ncbi:MAG: hypothetical protein VR67_03785 [Peptococcaceae bacterium BRH_c8a]|nr:MAG: hypothetical protein VR67_03785 [Peptococcaceae bacterium BRH_c8a]
MPTHLIRAGETPALIAERYGVPERWLYQANNYYGTDYARPGRRIYIPDYEYDYYDYPRQWGRNRYRDGMRYEIITGRKHFRPSKEIPVIFSYCNLSDRPRTLRYDDARLYDIVTSRGGREIWRWSDGYNYDRGSQTMLLQPGECRTYQADWDLRDRHGAYVKHGPYTLRAYDRSQELRTHYVDTDVEVLDPEVEQNVFISTNSTPCPNTNILLNAGLEQWVDRTTPRAWSALNLQNTSQANSGNYAAELGSKPLNQAVLSQLVRAEPDRTYRVVFGAMENVNNGNNGNFDLEAAVYVFDQQSRQIGRVDPVYTPDQLPDNDYREYSFNTGALPAGTHSMELRFTFRPRSGNRSRVRIDDVELTCVN